ncbi:inner-membrane translocator (plasmid) [Streptomyces sp. NBC_01220]|uniref:inner-membrane translocator n=1 Tax=Streptomyces sp. NBC_01220 TaxID=2903781 RepID=UPI002F9181B4|nr:inner-membrane translocator [Streptomyces sp. NBC_01220]WSQ49450.1 inner-membrane translocator [Streptomyces sp. NBC_01220]
MSDRDGSQPSGRKDALTGGCLLLLVLVADVAAALLVAIMLAVRGLDRMDSSSGQTATSGSPQDWAPVLGFGALALVVGITAVVLLRIGHHAIGAVQMILCALVALIALTSWP